MAPVAAAAASVVFADAPRDGLTGAVDGAVAHRSCCLPATTARRPSPTDQRSPGRRRTSPRRRASTGTCRPRRRRSLTGVQRLRRGQTPVVVARRCSRERCRRDDWCCSVLRLRRGRQRGQRSDDRSRGGGSLDTTLSPRTDPSWFCEPTKHCLTISCQLLLGRVERRIQRSVALAGPDRARSKPRRARFRRACGHTHRQLRARRPTNLRRRRRAGPRRTPRPPPPPAARAGSPARTRRSAATARCARHRRRRGRARRRPRGRTRSRRPQATPSSMARVSAPRLRRISRPVNAPRAFGVGVRGCARRSGTAGTSARPRPAPTPPASSVRPENSPPTTPRSQASDPAAESITHAHLVPGAGHGVAEGVDARLGIGPVLRAGRRTRRRTCPWRSTAAGRPVDADAEPARGWSPAPAAETACPPASGRSPRATRAPSATTPGRSRASAAPRRSSVAWRRPAAACRRRRRRRSPRSPVSLSRT